MFWNYYIADNNVGLHSVNSIFSLLSKMFSGECICIHATEPEIRFLFFNDGLNMFGCLNSHSNLVSIQ